MSKKELVRELIFGIHSIVELLKAKRRAVLTLYTTDPAPKQWHLISALLTPKTQVHIVSRDMLTKLAQTTDHQGVVGWAQPFPYRVRPFNPAQSPFLVLLDSVQDPRNVGAIIRSAYCTGVNGVIIPKKSTAMITPAALKASAGLAEYIDILVASSTSSAVQELKKAGYTIYVTTIEGANVTTVQYTKPLCVVIGNEAIGISPEIRKMGVPIGLPQKRTDISYNASVAAGITLFLIAQQMGTI